MMKSVFLRSPKWRNAFIATSGRFLLIAYVGLSLRSLASDSPRERLSREAGWKFHLAVLLPDDTHLSESGHAIWGRAIVGSGLLSPASFGLPTVPGPLFP